MILVSSFLVGPAHASQHFWSIDFRDPGARNLSSSRYPTRPVSPSMSNLSTKCRGEREKEEQERSWADSVVLQRLKFQPIKGGLCCGGAVSRFGRGFDGSGGAELELREQRLHVRGRGNRGLPPGGLPRRADRGFLQEWQLRCPEQARLGPLLYCLARLGHSPFSTSLITLRRSVYPVCSQLCVLRSYSYYGHQL